MDKQKIYDICENVRQFLFVEMERMLLLNTDSKTSNPEEIRKNINLLGRRKKKSSKSRIR